MPKYQVSYTSTATYWITVDAENEEHAIDIGGDKIAEGEYDHCENDDGYFMFNEANEINE